MTRALTALLWLAAGAQITACAALHVPATQLALMLAAAALATTAAVLATLDETRRH